MPSFQSPLPNSGRPWTPGDLRRLVRLVLPGFERRRLEERHRDVEHGRVARPLDVARDRVG
jgi:hypothetical protein